MTNEHTKITSTHPIDDDIVMINGVKYQRIVEKPKPQTLYDIIREWNDNEDYPTCEELVNRIEKWLPLEGCRELKSYEYSAGWNDCLKTIKTNLRPSQELDPENLPYFVGN